MKRVVVKCSRPRNESSVQGARCGRVHVFGGAGAVGNHTLEEGLGLGRRVVGVFCSRHDRTLREVAEDMTRREFDPSGTQLASVEEPAPREPEEEEYAEVELIIRQRDHQAHGPQYKVRRVGYNNTRNSWVRLGDLNCPELLANFKEVQRQRGMPDVGAADAQSEKLYYGPQTLLERRKKKKDARRPRTAREVTHCDDCERRPTSHGPVGQTSTAQSCGYRCHGSLGAIDNRMGNTWIQRSGNGASQLR